MTVAVGFCRDMPRVLGDGYFEPPPSFPVGVRSPSGREEIRANLTYFPIYYRNWIQDYTADWWSPLVPHVVNEDILVRRRRFFPFWNLSQEPWRPRFPDIDSWNRFVTNASVLPRAYALQKRWDLDHPNTQRFVRKAEIILRGRIQSLKSLQRHLDL